jgi:hypothetical protein
MSDEESMPANPELSGPRKERSYMPPTGCETWNAGLTMYTCGERRRGTLSGRLLGSANRERTSAVDGFVLEMENGWIKGLAEPGSLS